jgi:glycogen debranching enzyme
MSDLVAEAVEKSRDLLVDAATPWGFVASPDFEHYAVIWARDALITCLGALRSGDARLIESAAATIDTLSAHASPLGQIPALVNPSRGTWDFAEGGVVDTSAWLAIVAAEHLDVTGDTDRTREWWPAVRAAIEWLAHQDVSGSGLISVAPSTDWMDAALTRSGRTLHLNVLYAWAIRSAQRIAETVGEEFRAPVADADGLVNAWFWPYPEVHFDDLYPSGFAHAALATQYRRLADEDRTHYVSHIIHAAFVDRLDVLANCLAVVGGVAGEDRSQTILEAIESSASPWPSRTFPEPIPTSDSSGMLIEAVDAVIDPRWSNTPGRYHNGAAWPYVGGFHAAAVAVTHGSTAAAPIVERLAAANALGGWRFPEWIGPDGPDGAARQTWNAGTFLYAWSMLEP